MLDIAFIREHADEVKTAAKHKNITVDIDALLRLDERRRALQQELDQFRHERNELAHAGKGGKPTPEHITAGKRVKAEIARLETESEEIERQYAETLSTVPNVVHPDVPIGKDDSENVEIERVGEPTQFDFEPKDHVTLGTELDILDFAAGATVAGSGFYYTKNELVWLEMALQQFALHKLAQKGYVPFTTPDMARNFAMDSTGYNPRGNEDQIYQIEGEDLSLIATAEITLGAYLANTTVPAENLPIKFAGVSHCFRKEAGAYGKESRGLYRVHQFSKVEMFVFCLPEHSEAMHEEMKAIEKELYTELGLPFRIVDICTGDLGGPVYRKYDLEAWMPMKNDWGEITSCSNCTDYQARRLRSRYKTQTGKNGLLHTLNGTAVNSSRIPLAIIENYQQADGSVRIPEALRPYMPNGMTAIRPK